MLSCTKSDYDLAEYLSAVRDKKQRQILSKDRLTDHKLVTEKGKQEKLLPLTIRICGHCLGGEGETLFFLTCKTNIK